MLVRSFAQYEHAIRRVFSRYDIRFFIDRREPLSHHPLAELTRYALRTLVSNWDGDDWFGALKTGLVHPDEGLIDRLENAALAHGWRGNTWLNPLKIPGEEELERRLEELRQQAMGPFSRLADVLAATQRQPTGPELAEALRGFWRDLRVEETLQSWSKAAAAARGEAREPAALPVIHAQAWEELGRWLEGLDLAFETTRLPLGDWLPVLESGLAGLSAGVIPLALDEVLVGEVDRSRNPNLEVVMVLGLNERVFPAPPEPAVLLNPNERDALLSLGLTLGLSERDQIGHERLLGYIACTRARRRLVATYARKDIEGKPLNPSDFVYHLQRLFPGLEPQRFDGTLDWRESVHPSELIAPLLRNGLQDAETKAQSLAALEHLPVFGPVLAQWEQAREAKAVTVLAEGVAGRIYGAELKTSISALEDYAACPFKFFVVRGLRAEERQEFEVDRRERGSFQHEVLMAFHRRLQAGGRRWRDLAPAEASELIGRIGTELQTTFREGLFLSTPARRFTARMLIDSLQQFIGVLVSWAPQYGFEPTAVELGFGLEDDGLGPWSIDLGNERVLLLRGRIDRVDLLPQADREAGATPNQMYAVVIDYKSGGRKLEEVKLVNGLDLQLWAYLGVLRGISDGTSVFGASKLVPAGAFYVGLRGNAGTARTRQELRENEEKARLAPYQHRGRFRSDLLGSFDNRGQSSGDQFRYALKKDGGFKKAGNEVLAKADFLGWVDAVEEFLRRYGQEIYAGDVRVSPYRCKNETACDHCDYRSLCRFDPWTEPYRVLRPVQGDGVSSR